MKKVFLLGALLFSTSVLASNPITEAVKEQAWPMYTCTMDVNGKEVITETNDIQYARYSIATGTEMFSYDVSETASLSLLIDRTQIYKEKETYGAIAYLYNGNAIVGKFLGKCTLKK